MNAHSRIVFVLLAAFTIIIAAVAAQNQQHGWFQSLLSTTTHTHKHKHKHQHQQQQQKQKQNSPFTALCERNRELCAELEQMGIHRQEQVPEMALAFWRTMLETSFESLHSEMMMMTLPPNEKHHHQHLQRLQRSGVFTKYQQHKKTSSDDDGKSWVDTLGQHDTDELRQIIEDAGLVHKNKNDKKNYPFFGFVPTYFFTMPINNITTTTATATYPLPATECTDFLGSAGTVSATLSPAAKQITITLNTTATSAKRKLFCIDYWHFAVGPTHIDADVMESSKLKTFVMDVSKNLAQPALAWDLENKGVRVFRGMKGKIERTLDLVDTLMLFLPMVTGKLDAGSAKKNMAFFNEYTGIEPAITERAYSSTAAGRNNKPLPLPEEEIQSGDFIAKSELDGLGPCEGLGQGTSAGHVAVALRLQQQGGGALMICESVIKGITCTPYREWAEHLQEIGMMTVLVPLGKEYREKFDLTKAWAWVNETYANAYGYPNVLLGWIDLAVGNYPTFPPEFKRPSSSSSSSSGGAAGGVYGGSLTAEALELLMWNLNDVVPKLVDFFIGQALNHRVGTWTPAGGLGFAEVLRAAGEKFPPPLQQQQQQQQETTTTTTTSRVIDLAHLLAIPEQDAWLYNTTRRGEKGSKLLPAQVCSTLGFNILRAGGVFDGPSSSRDWQATEIDCWDAYSMAIWDADRVGDNRPALCKQADPDNMLCQLTGNYTFNLQAMQHGRFNSRRPFPNMNQVCATQNPAPYNHDGCFAPSSSSSSSSSPSSP